MKSDTITVKLTRGDVEVIAESLRLLALESRRRVGSEKLTIEFSQRNGINCVNARRRLIRAEQLAAGVNLATAAMRKAAAR